MATPSVTAPNNPNGLGFRQGYFSGDPEAATNQAFFDAAFAGRIHEDKIYKEAFNCNILGDCAKTMSAWMDEFMGYSTSCYPSYTLLEYHNQNLQIEVGANVTIPATGTGNITISANSHYVSGAYVLPQVGDIIVLTPNGSLAEVVTVTHATADDTVIAVRQLSSTVGTSDVVAGDKLLVLPGKILEDCECPEGAFRFDDLPIERDLEMFTFANRGELCGDALNACQYLKIPFTDECGNTIERWYTKALQDMYRDHELSKHYQRLLNPNFGIIPTIKALGMKFTPASENEITTDDIRAWKQDMNEAGLTCMEFAVWAGRAKFSQFQRMLLTAGVTQLDASQQPLNDCKWLNMEWCGIRVEGMVLHIYEECTFSNGKLLGGPNMVFPNSAIFVPMCERTTNCRGGYDNRMVTTVYFKSTDGRVHDNLTDSNGVLNGPNGRNSFGAGCEQHEWTIKSRFTQEVHCANAWGYMGL